MTVDIAALRQQSLDFNQSLTRRNHVEAVAGAIVIALFGANLFNASTLLESLACGLIIAGALFVVGFMYTRGKAPAVEPAVSTREFLDQRRHELKYQARLLRWVPVWYIGPLMPGFSLLIADAWLSAPTTSTFLVSFLLPIGTVLALVIGLNVIASRRLEREASELPTL